MLISVTRLHLRSVRQLPAFLWYALLSAFQAKRSPGLIKSRLHRENTFTYWTLTAWDSEIKMMVFRNKNHHRKAMQKSKELADQLELVRWEADTLPTLEDAMARLHQAYGRRVDNLPSQK